MSLRAVLLFGGSPLLQQGELGFQAERSASESILPALAAGIRTDQRSSPMSKAALSPAHGAFPFHKCRVSVISHVINCQILMALAPQETRTFFTSSATWERRSILQSTILCDLLLDVIRENRAKQRLQMHEFVFMRDHVHLILTLAPLVPLEKAMQFIKGGFSFRAKKELNFNGEIWQKSYNEHRIKGEEEYAQHVEYIWMNPVKARLLERAEEFLYSSARLRAEVDRAPLQFQRKA